MKSLLNSIQEKLIITKDTKEKENNNSIQELSNKYKFDLISLRSNTTSEGKQFNYKEYKVSNNLFKTSISDKIVEVNDQELKQFANNLNYHFKDILDNKFTIELTNYTNYDYVWGIIRINNKDNKNITQALYDCIKSTIGFKIVKDENEAEKILANVIDYIVNN